MSKPPDHIRPIAIAIIEKQGNIFVFEGYDHIKGETFYRPLGGAIEFGEYGIQALRRELNEEIGKGITNIIYRGTIENIFTQEGAPGHEIVLIYKADFVDSSIYNESILFGKEDNGDQFKALWIPTDDFKNKKKIIYPEGILDFIERPARM